MCTLKYSKIATLGYKCILYMMKIKEEGIYIPVMVKRFFLVEDLENAVNIPAIVESFFFVKVQLEKKVRVSLILLCFTGEAGCFQKKF